jgi:hypothetical protein
MAEFPTNPYSPINGPTQTTVTPFRVQTTASGNTTVIAAPAVSTNKYRFPRLKIQQYGSGSPVTAILYSSGVGSFTILDDVRLAGTDGHGVTYGPENFLETSPGQSLVANLSISGTTVGITGASYLVNTNGVPQ